MSDAFLFIRHGETDYNRRGVRCGGDIDIPLTAQGAAQAKAAAEQLLADGLRPDAIFVSPLQRTRRTAEILAETLGFTEPLIPHEGLRERRLGDWNGQPIADTQAWFDAKLTPPGGESETAFRTRLERALVDILVRPYRLPLLVGSKGVARIFVELTGGARTAPVGNAEVVRFPRVVLPRLATETYATVGTS
ncbi:hypothetical protein VZ95_03985 [Elstera litoralis]|uniref:Phosphoglycerate mutase n=1 Tax=Elstera litoralis TaxID=552518 RepID=A0A0F3IVD0_9PROT|nr:histidine phosphatase family protein [Elstera litoralis]KJV10577.1 hypothetical protein VZ95_03985 [Elstera litoralis]